MGSLVGSSRNYYRKGTAPQFNVSMLNGTLRSIDSCSFNSFIHSIDLAIAMNAARNTLRSKAREAPNMTPLRAKTAQVNYRCESNCGPREKQFDLFFPSRRNTPIGVISFRAFPLHAERTLKTRYTGVENTDDYSFRRPPNRWEPR